MIEADHQTFQSLSSGSVRLPEGTSAFRDSAPGLLRGRRSLEGAQNSVRPIPYDKDQHHVRKQSYRPLRQKDGCAPERVQQEAAKERS
jgi:hypothetical protein